jgi:hypothetical protein
VSVTATPVGARAASRVCGRGDAGRHPAMYIGVGTLVVILIILLIIYVARRA